MNNNPKILIVDDAIDNRFFLKTILKKDGYIFMEASNGEEGIGLALSELPDIILMDASMPIMDGFTATEILKSDPSTERIPILMITAIQEMEKKIFALEKGVSDFISKPFDKTELIARCRSLVKSSRLNQKYILATRNPITNLPNKISLQEELLEVINPKLFIIAIDGFEEMVDFYGEDDGRELERNIAEKLILKVSRCLARYKYKIYHIGNAKFGILFNDESNSINSIDAEDISLLLINYLKNTTVSFREHEYIMTLTIGYAFGVKKLIERASLALNHARKTDKDYLFDEQIIEKINFEIENNLFWVKKLRKSLANNKIIPFFQPILNNKTKKIEKYETLVRLIDDNGDIVSPFKFLEASKKSKFYHHITKIMIDKSFKIFESVDAQFSINLSSIDIDNIDTRELIFEKLTNNSRLASRVIFEILESESINNTEAFIGFIHKVKKYGAKIAIDDFGSGYSNFERILILDVDIIKIDGSLIEKIDKNSDFRDIVSLISGFAKKKNIKTVAEFVKDKSIYNSVLELGIDYSQGYFIAKPSKDLVTSFEED